jgi:hypothetical protein
VFIGGEEIKQNNPEEIRNKGISAAKTAKQRVSEETRGAP